VLYSKQHLSFHDLFRLCMMRHPAAWCFYSLPSSYTWMNWHLPCFFNKPLNDDLGYVFIMKLSQSMIFSTLRFSGTSMLRLHALSPNPPLKQSFEHEQILHARCHCHNHCNYSFMPSLCEPKTGLILVICGAWFIKMLHSLTVSYVLLTVSPSMSVQG